MELQTSLDSVMLIALDLSLVKCNGFHDSKQTPQVETLAFHLILSPPVQIQMRILIEKHINILFSVVSSCNCDEQVHVECSCEDGPNQFKCFHCNCTSFYERSYFSKISSTIFQSWELSPKDTHPP